MIFFFKKKPIVLHCVTDRTELLELCPVKRASKFFPDWWKKLDAVKRHPEKLKDFGTMKNCTGFHDLYSSGAIIPMWCDLLMQIGPIGTSMYRYQFSDEVSSAVSHTPEQHGNHFDKHIYQHIKLSSPWHFVCDEDINFLALEPTWSFINFNQIRVLPGVINYKHQTSTNINMMIRRSSDFQEILIPFLEPMFHVVPLSDRPLKIILSDDEKLYNKAIRTGYKSTFISKYKANIKARKESD